MEVDATLHVMIDSHGSQSKEYMRQTSQKKIEESVGNGVVLDIGGWGNPFHRANYVVDMFPYETRGIAVHGIGHLPVTQLYSEPLPGEHFRKDTWIIHDICSEIPLPFPDKMFDFVICSHTLEDVRDPLRACSEIIRVGRAGYIETPSRIGESILWNGMVGAAHHRWLVDAVGNRLEFRMKHYFLHTNPHFYISTSFARKIPFEDRYMCFFWEDSFEYIEISGYEYYGETAAFIEKLNIPRYYYFLDGLRNIKYTTQAWLRSIFQRYQHRLPPNPASSSEQETWTWPKLFEVSKMYLDNSE
jgi:SAM-dependent methyltransferase